MKKTNKQSGFTLLEVLLVIAIIAILAGIVIVAINPAKQLGDANDTQRRADVNAVLNGAWQYALDNGATMPAGLDAVTTSYQVLGTDAAGCDTTCGAETTVAGCLDLSADLVPTYLVGIPEDPSTGTAGNTDYAINKDANDRLSVSSCDPDQAATINVTR